MEVLLSSGDDGDPDGKERRDFAVSGDTTRASEAPSSFLLVSLMTSPYVTPKCGHFNTDVHKASLAIHRKICVLFYIRVLEFAIGIYRIAYKKFD